MKKQLPGNKVIPFPLNSLGPSSGSEAELKARNEQDPEKSRKQVEQFKNYEQIVFKKKVDARPMMHGERERIVVAQNMWPNTSRIFCQTSTPNPRPQTRSPPRVGM